MSIVIRFIKSDKHDKLIKEAFEAITGIQEDKVDRVWFTNEQCLSVEKRDRHVIYVFNEFSGSPFQHIMSLNCRIYGPPCILECIRNEEMLVKTSHPVYCLTLKGVTICCTNLSAKIRDEVYEKVNWMNGQSSKDLHEQVTHLVAGEVGSKKYIVAATLGKTIVTPEWVDAIWLASQTQTVNYKDPQFNKYKCPILKGLQICISGLNVEERGKIKSIVEDSGGKFSGEMKLNECTHLLINQPTGHKFKFATQWKISTVTPQWLYDCVAYGRYLDETKYLVLPKQQIAKTCSTSTPTKDTHHDANMTGISNISAFSVSSINETDLKLSIATSKHLSSTNQLDISKFDDPLEQFNVKNHATNQCFSGCKIFLCGIKSPLLEKAKLIVSQGSGIRFNKMNESVTHIVVGKEDISHAEKLACIKQQSNVHTVDLQWLLDSYTNGRLANEFKYIKDLESLVTQQLKHSEINKSVDITSLSTKKIEESANLKNLLSQYIQEETGDLANENTLIRTETENEVDDLHLESMECDDDKKLFEKKTFVIFCKNMEANIEELIKEYSGTVLQKNTRQIADYAVVEVFEEPIKITVHNIVTAAWLQDCINESNIIPTTLKEIYLPIACAGPYTPLTSCVISLSGFTSTEKDVLKYLLENFGAKVQDAFVCKSDGTYLGSSHLICASPTGSKYEASIKWKIPAVSKHWIFDCVKTGKKMPEKSYLVTNLENSNKDDKDLTESNFYEKTNKINTTISCLSSEKETASKYINKPTSIKNTRVKALIDEAKEKSAEKRSPHASRNEEDSFNAAAETPSKYLFVNEYQPKFQLDTTDNSPVTTSKATGRQSIALEDLFAQNINIAILNANNESNMMDNSLNKDIGDNDPALSQQEASKPLEGVVIWVAKKLGRNQSEYNKIALSLGAQYRWTYEDQCTHFIFQGRQNDTTKEFRIARDQGKIIVSPYWLFACEEKFARMDETQYPHTFNPNLSLSMSSSKTPIRPTRSTALKTQSINETSLTNNTLLTNNTDNTINDNSCSNTMHANAPPTFISTAHNNIIENNDSVSLTRKSEIVTEPHVISINEENNVKTDTNDKNKSALIIKPFNESVIEDRADFDNFGDGFSNLDNDDAQLSEACGNVEKQEMNKHTELLTDLKRLTEASRSGKLNRNQSSFEKEKLEIGDARRLRLSRNESLLDEDKKNRSAKTSRNITKPMVDTQPSQSVEVNWDYPAAREQIKILSSEMRNRSPAENHCTTIDKLALLTSSTFTPVSKDLCQKTLPNSTSPKRNILKELATPGNLANGNTSVISEPKLASMAAVYSNEQNVAAVNEANTTWDSLNADDTILKCIKMESTTTAKYSFMFSGLAQNEREEYGVLIRKLGGVALDATNYDDAASHLIIHVPTRNEKFLAFVSTGKWALHKSYLDECRKENAFIKEEPFEWGEYARKHATDAKLNPQQSKLAAAAIRWRLQLCARRQTGESTKGAFEKWTCILLVDCRKEDGFKRLLEAGGALIKPNTEPLNCNNVTHLFIEPSKIKLQLDYKSLVQMGIHCLKPEYIASYLSDEPAPNPTSNYIEDVLKILSEDDSKKRRFEDHENTSKRIKL